MYQADSEVILVALKKECLPLKPQTGTDQFHPVLCERLTYLLHTFITLDITFAFDLT